MCLARDNVTQLSDPDSRGDMYTASFELFPFHEGSSYSFFMGIMNGNGPLRGQFCVVRAMMDKCAKARDWATVLRRSYEAARLASEFNKLLGYVAVVVQIPILTQVETISDFSCLFRCLKPHDKYLKPDEFVTIEPFLSGIFQNFDSTIKTSPAGAKSIDEDSADEDDLNTCFCTYKKSKYLDKSKDNDRNSCEYPLPIYRKSRDLDFTNNEDRATDMRTSPAYTRNYATDDKNFYPYTPSAYTSSMEEDFTDDDDDDDYLGSCLCISAAFRKSKTRDCSFNDKISHFGSEEMSPPCLLGNSSTNIATAFSHFSWHFTRQLLVCDLQGLSNGVAYTLTNPTIHSTNCQFGEGDGSTPAILNFFSSHRCSNVCRHWDTYRCSGRPQRRVSFRHPAGDSSYLSRFKPDNQISPFLLRDNCLGTLL